MNSMKKFMIEYYSKPVHIEFRVFYIIRLGLQNELLER